MSRAECDIRDQIGVGRIMWGADYPHIEGTWPHSLNALREACNGCTAEEIRLMASETAADVYGFDLARCSRTPTGSVLNSTSLVTPAVPAPATYPEVDYALGKVSGMESGRRLMAAMLGS